MKEAKIYLDEKIINKDNFMTDWGNSPVFKTIMIEDNENLWDNAIKINDDFYSVCCSQGQNYAVYKLDFYDSDEDLELLVDYNEDNLRCPVCGYEESDCWEYSSDSEDEHECQGCGSILSWEREYTVTYETKVIKRNEFKEI